MNIELARDLFPVGTSVNVVRMEGDQFNHDFTGTVAGFRRHDISIRDQDGDVWDVDPNQVSFSSDDNM